MLPTSAAALQDWCYPIPSHLLHSHPSHFKTRILGFRNTGKSCCLPLHTSHNCSIKQRDQNIDSKSNSSHPFDSPKLYNQFSSPVKTTSIANKNPRAQDQEHQEPEHQSREAKSEVRGVLSTNMWWVDLKAALGQRINIEGIVSSASVFVKDCHLALPHVAVPDIRYIDWGELKRRGFKGVVFDKDNTITAPYSLTLWAPLQSSIEQCKAVFGHDMAVFSNSAGLFEYDHDGSKARALEGTIGIRVIRHKVKKPAGTAEEIEKHFGCASSQLIMVGDRPFTDIVYGNRNGCLTVLTEPLSLTQEPFIVRQVRKVELCLVNHWFRRGLKPISHDLLPDVMCCVKDPPVL